MILTKRQTLLLRALRKHFYNVTRACKEARVPRRTYYNWLEDIPKFREAAEEVEQDLLVVIEDRLKEAALENQPWAIKFFLSRRHPDYKPRAELEVTGPEFIFDDEEETTT